MPGEIINNQYDSKGIFDLNNSIIEGVEQVKYFDRLNRANIRQQQIFEHHENEVYKKTIE